MPYEFLDEPQAPKSESLPATIGRNAVRGVARAAETIAGLPGDIGHLLLGITNKGIESATGAPSESIKGVQSYLPTSEKIKEKVTKNILPEDYVEPQGATESFIDEIVSDAAGLAFPIKGKVPGVKSLARSFGQALAGNVAKETAKAYGVGNTGQALAKVGVMTLAGFQGSRKALEGTADASYTKVGKYLKGKESRADKLYKTAKEIYDDASAGYGPESKLVKDQAESVLNNIYTKNGKRIINAEEAWKFAKGTNRYLKKGLDEAARPSFERLSGAAKEATRGAIKNNEVLNEFKKAEEIYTGLFNRNKVTKVLDKHVSIDSLKNPLTKILIFGGFATPKAAAKAAVGGLTAREISRAYDLLSQSKTAQKYYGEVLANALKGHGAAAARKAVKLDQALSKQDSETNGRYEFLD